MVVYALTLAAGRGYPFAGTDCSLVSHAHTHIWMDVFFFFVFVLLFTAFVIKAACGTPWLLLLLRWLLLLLLLLLPLSLPFEGV